MERDLEVGRWTDELLMQRGSNVAGGTMHEESQTERQGLLAMVARSHPSKASSASWSASLSYSYSAPSAGGAIEHYPAQWSL